MKVYLEEEILFIDQDDVPSYKKGGSIIRNTYFWALKSIACYSRQGKDWEFDPDVWIALCRMLLSFSQSGYLGDCETLLEFPSDTPIPEVLRPVSTWL